MKSQAAASGHYNDLGSKYVVGEAEDCELLDRGDQRYLHLSKIMEAVHK